MEHSVSVGIPPLQKQFSGAGKAFFLKQTEVSSENIAVTLTKRDHVIYAAELELNSLPMHVCQNLVRNSLHVQLGSLTGAHIVVKGKYFCEEDKLKLTAGGNELPYRALYLDVTAQNLNSVEDALHHLGEKITSSMQHRPKPAKKNNQMNVAPQVPVQPIPPPPIQVPPSNVAPLASAAGIFLIPNSVSNPPPYVAPINQPGGIIAPVSNTSNAGVNPQPRIQQAQPLPEEKLPVGVTLINSPNSFKLVQKLTGENNVNLDYIQRESGALVILRGLGSGYLEPTTNKEARESLHFRITALDNSIAGTDAINKARNLLTSLLDTLRDDLKKHTTLNSQNMSQNVGQWTNSDRSIYPNMYHASVNQPQYS